MHYADMIMQYRRRVPPGVVGCEQLGGGGGGGGGKRRSGGWGWEWGGGRCTSKGCVVRKLIFSVVNYVHLSYLTKKWGEGGGNKRVSG